MSIAGWPSYDPFLNVLLSGQSVYELNPLRPNPNPQNLCHVGKLGQTLTTLLLVALKETFYWRPGFYLGKFCCTCLHLHSQNAKKHDFKSHFQVLLFWAVCKCTQCVQQTLPMFKYFPSTHYMFREILISSLKFNCFWNV